ncbi:hypothetical protein STENM327S_05704 [Streptomyces tendae]
MPPPRAPGHRRRPAGRGAPAPPWRGAAAGGRGKALTRALTVPAIFRPGGARYDRHRDTGEDMRQGPAQRGAGRRPAGTRRLPPPAEVDVQASGAAEVLRPRVTARAQRRRQPRRPGPFGAREPEGADQPDGVGRVVVEGDDLQRRPPAAVPGDNGEALVRVRFPVLLAHGPVLAPGARRLPRARTTPGSGRPSGSRRRPSSASVPSARSYSAATHDSHQRRGTGTRVTVCWKRAMRRGWPPGGRRVMGVTGQ